MSTEVETRGEFRPKETPEPAQVLDQVVAATPRQTLIGRAADFLGTKPAQIFNLLRGKWKQTKGEKPLSDEELTSGLALIARYELDPFAKEIYVARDKKGGLMTIIGVDGWIKILDRTPGYDGFTQEFTFTDSTETVMKSVTTTIYSKLRSHPVKYVAFMTEYKKQAGFVFATMPMHMLRIFSLRHAIRLFTPISCATTEQEARFMVAAEPESPSVSDLLRGDDVPTVGETEAKPMTIVDDLADKVSDACATKLPEDKVPFGAGKPGPDEDLIDRQVSEFVEMLDNAQDVQQCTKLASMADKDEIIQIKPESITRVNAAYGRALDRIREKT